MTENINLKPETMSELVATVQAVTEAKVINDDGYQAAADALWQAAVAAFNYVAHVEGVTGFQAGYAALRFYGEAMHINGPYAILNGEDVVYPQYDIVGKAKEYEVKWRAGWGAEKARELLAEHEQNGFEFVHPEVRQHWESLAEQEATP